MRALHRGLEGFCSEGAIRVVRGCWGVWGSTVNKMASLYGNLN